MAVGNQFGRPARQSAVVEVTGIRGVLVIVRHELVHGAGRRSRLWKRLLTNLRGQVLKTGTEKQVPTPVLSRVASERLGLSVAAIERCLGDSDEITEEKKMKINMQVERNAMGKPLPVRTNLKGGGTRAGLEKGSRK